ncbi:DUF6186 family protein [Paramicrobacterium chengjingii]|nr:DUF6186 family protein [Microbacterium chengjingii]
MHVVTLGVYLFCLAAAAALTLWSDRRPATVSPPSRILDEIFVSNAGRITVIVFWWWIGWHFLFAQTLDG